MNGGLETIGWIEAQIATACAGPFVEAPTSERQSYLRRPCTRTARCTVQCGDSFVRMLPAAEPGCVLIIDLAPNDAATVGPLLHPELARTLLIKATPGNRPFIAQRLWWPTGHAGRFCVCRMRNWPARRSQTAMMCDYGTRT